MGKGYRLILDDEIPPITSDELFRLVSSYSDHDAHVVKETWASDASIALAIIPKAITHGKTGEYLVDGVPQTDVPDGIEDGLPPSLGSIFFWEFSTGGRIKVFSNDYYSSWSFESIDYEPLDRMTALAWAILDRTKGRQYADDWRQGIQAEEALRKLENNQDEKSFFGRGAEYSLDVIDAAISRTIAQIIQVNLGQADEDDVFVRLQDIAKRFAIREVVDTTEIIYHWYKANPLQYLGGITLRKKRAEYTEILFQFPPRQIESDDCLKWNKRVVENLQREGYLTPDPRTTCNDRASQAKTFLDESWPTTPDLLKPHIESIINSASKSTGPLYGVSILGVFRVGDFGKQYFIGWDNFSMLGHIEIVPSTHNLSRITITSYNQSFAGRQELADDFLAEIANELIKICMPERVAQEKNRPGQADNKKSQPGPTIRTQQRFQAIKSVKEAHPEWSQEKVAMVLNEQEGTDIYSAEMIRNTYRAMGEKWERADRIR